MSLPLPWAAHIPCRIVCFGSILLLVFHLFSFWDIFYRTEVLNLQWFTKFQGIEFKKWKEIEIKTETFPTKHTNYPECECWMYVCVWEWVSGWVCACFLCVSNIPFFCPRQMKNQTKKLHYIVKECLSQFSTKFYTKCISFL